MVQRIIDSYLAGLETGRLVVPGFGTYIKRDGETTFVEFLRTDDGVLISLIIKELDTTEMEAMAIIAEYVAQLRAIKPAPQPDTISPSKRVEVPVETPAVSPATPVVTQAVKPVETYPDHSAKRSRRKIDPLIIIAIIAILCVIGTIIVSYVRNGGEGLGF